MRMNYFEHPITKRFIDAFPKFERENEEDTKVYFWEGWQNSPFYDQTIEKESIKDCYNHLLAHYYNWHFIFPDDLGIALNVYEKVGEYLPNVITRLDLVRQLRELSLEEFKKSGITISSSGSNPKVATEMDELIDLVDTQNANFQLKSQEQVIKAKFMSLYDGIFEDFVKKFEYMFVKLYNGVNSYIYCNPINEKNEEEGE